MSDFSLGPSEVILLQVEDVERMEFPSVGVKSRRIQRGQMGNLILTNERVVFSWQTGVFKRETHVESFSLQDIKIYKNVAQVKASKPLVAGAPYPVNIFFVQEQVEFQFPVQKKDSIQPLIEAINEELVGIRQGFSPSDIAEEGVFSEIVSMMKTMTIGTTAGKKEASSPKPSYLSVTCPNCNGANRVLEGTVAECQFCGSPLETSVRPSLSQQGNAEDAGKGSGGGLAGIADVATGVLDGVTKIFGNKK